MARTDWQQAEGKVVGVDWINTRGRRQLIVTFVYAVEGKSYESKLYTFDSMHEGDSLVVRYDVSNPERNKFRIRQKRINRTAFVVAVLVVGVALFLIWFSVRR